MSDCVEVRWYRDVHGSERQSYVSFHTLEKFAAGAPRHNIREKLAVQASEQSGFDIHERSGWRAYDLDEIVEKVWAIKFEESAAIAKRARDERMVQNRKRAALDAGQPRTNGKA